MSVQPPICYTEVHHMTILQLMALADDAYNNKGNSTLKVVKDAFFKDADFTIESAGLVSDADAKMVRYNITFNQSDIGLMVFSIRGSSTRKDWWLDIEFFTSSLMFTVCKRLNPFVSRLDSYSYETLAKLITAPERLMISLTLVPKYIKDLSKGYEKNRDTTGNMTEMFVGHSLGGGLAKIMGSKYHLSSVSLSGPGISAFQGMFELPNTKYGENFATNNIDIVPDMDLVPRVEISGGTQYRVLCQEGNAECHSSMHSLCMVSVRKTGSRSSLHGKESRCISKDQRVRQVISVNSFFKKIQHEIIHPKIYGEK